MKAVIYARYSSDNQREESIEGQLRECKDFAEKNGMTILATYIDRALSAKTDNRPEFQRMIKDSSKNLFDVIIVWKLDRFARNRYDSAYYKSVLRKNGVKVISAKESISEGPEGIILESMLEGYAEYYSAELAQKVTRGMTENALKCRYNGGTMPLGYMTDKDKHLVINPDTAPIVMEIFTRYADGETVKEITDSLNSKGLKSTTGANFNKSSLHSILKNRKYIGEYKYSDIVIENGIPAIVSNELFEKVQSRMTTNQKAPAKAKAPVEYLLTTKLFCGMCGALMLGESGHGYKGVVYNYYKCATAKKYRNCKKKTIKKHIIEKAVVQRVKEIIFDDYLIDKITDAIIELLNKENTIIPVLQKQLKEVEVSIENMLNAIQQGILTKSTKQRLDELEKQKEELELSIAQEQIKRPRLTKEEILVWIKKFRHGDIDDVKYQKRIIDSFVNSVYLYDDKIVLNCNYKEGSTTITFDEINNSDLEGNASPKIRTHKCADFYLLLIHYYLWRWYIC